MFYQPTNYPDIFLSLDKNNPILSSPNSDYTIEYALTRDKAYDLEEYKAFLDSAIRRFRHSRTYTHYKAYLLSLGLNTCIYHPYIQSSEDAEIASLEMHHCMLNIYDIVIIITEHILNTYGQITEFDLSELLKLEHINNRIPIVMLCKNCHQLYHHKYLYVQPDVIFGKWWELLENYKTAFDQNTEIAFKIVKYLDRSIGDNLIKENKKREKLLQLRDNILSWSKI